VGVPGGSASMWACCVGGITAGLEKKGGRNVVVVVLERWGW